MKNISPKTKDIIITQEGLNKLLAELDNLKKVRRPEVISRIKGAKELGDLSENAEYAAAKDEQSFVEGRIQELDQIIKKLKVVKEANGQQKTALPGSRLTVAVEGDELNIELVGQTEADPAKGKISIDSPVGKALLGHKGGDNVNVQTPDGEIVYRIVTLA